MGTVHKFKRPPKNKGQFRGYKPPGEDRGPKGPKHKWGLIHSLVVLLGGAVAAYLLFSGVPDHRQVGGSEAIAVDADNGAAE